MDTVLRGRAVELFAEAVPGLDGGKAEGNKWRYMEEQDCISQLLISVVVVCVSLLLWLNIHLLKCRGNTYLRCLCTLKIPGRCISTFADLAQSEL